MVRVSSIGNKWACTPKREDIRRKGVKEKGFDTSGKYSDNIAGGVWQLDIEWKDRIRDEWIPSIYLDDGADCGIITKLIWKNERFWCKGSRKGDNELLLEIIYWDLITYSKI